MKSSSVALISLVLIASVSSYCQHVDAHLEYHHYRSVGEFLRNMAQSVNPANSQQATTTNPLSPVQSLLAIPATVVHYFTQHSTTSGHQPNAVGLPSTFQTLLPNHDVPHAGVSANEPTKQVEVDRAGKCECASAPTNTLNSELTESLMESVKSVEELDDALTQIQTASKASVVPANTVQSQSPASNTNEVVEPTIVTTNNDVVVEQRVGKSENHDLPDQPPVALGMPALVPASVDNDFGADLRELKQVHADLDRIIENLDKEHHRIHSTMFKALRAYVTSIQKRVELQQKSQAQRRAHGVAQKITALKARLSEAILKLKVKLTLRPLQTITNPMGPAVVQVADARLDGPKYKSIETVDFFSQSPVQVPVKVPMPVQTPVQVRVQTPVQVPEQAPVQVPEQAPVQVPVQTPVRVPEQAPVQVPEQAPVPVPEQAPVPVPEQAPEQAPVLASVPEQVPVAEKAAPAEVPVAGPEHN